MATPPSRTPIAGGFMLAIAPIVGTVIGAAMGQASLGFVAGVGVGLAFVAGVWLVDRARTR
jgi:hypothetical protein